MSRLVEKVELPVYREFYIANSEYASMENLQYVQEALKKLYEYEQAEEDGLLIRLPCKIGESIFTIIQGEIFELELKDFRRNPYCKDGKDSAVDLYCVNVNDNSDHRYIYIYNSSEIYHTQEQAEQKLKEMEENDDAQRKPKESPKRIGHDAAGGGGLS